MCWQTFCDSHQFYQNIHVLWLYLGNLCLQYNFSNEFKIACTTSSVFNLPFESFIPILIFQHEHTDISINKSIYVYINNHYLVIRKKLRVSVLVYVIYSTIKHNMLGTQKCCLRTLQDLLIFTASVSLRHKQHTFLSLSFWHFQPKWFPVHCHMLALAE